MAAALTSVASLAFAASLARPLPAQGLQRFDTGVVAGAAWLQANSLPMERKAAESGALAVSLRRQNWAVEGGWLRVARTLSTVHGVSVTAGPLLHWGPVLFIPALGVFGGQAQESRDSTGYDFVAAGGLTGHQPRYSYSSAASAGGGAGLTVECAVYRALGVRAVVQEWYFSGAPLEGDRARTLLGAGLSLRVRR